MTRREEFVRIALTWQDVPWRKVGCRRDGVNCVGLFIGVAKECSFPIGIASKASEANYVRPAVSGHMLKQAGEDMDPIPAKDVIPGDLLLFRLSNEPSHITIVVETNPLMLVHSDTPFKKVRLVPLPLGWVPLIGFRIRELDKC